MAPNKKILSSISTKPYFHSGDFVLYKADALKILEQLPEGSIDMIFADPPYNLSNDGFSVHAGKRVSVNKGNWDKSKGFEDDYEFHHTWLAACRRVLEPNGTLWVSGTYHSIYQCGHAIQALGYHILNDIAWFKPNASPNLSCRYFTASHETLIWARKEKKAKHRFDYPTMKGWKDNYRAKFDSPSYDKNGRRIMLTIYPEVIHKTGLQMRSVWAIGTPKREEKIYGKHPTQKPLALLDRVILSSTKKGSIVLDPFTGSSTTGISAISHGRKFIGVDLEKQYLDVSVKRYKDLSK